MIRSLTSYDLGTASKRLGDYVDPQTGLVYGNIQKSSNHRILMQILTACTTSPE
jgi:hypothetical protein